MSDLTKQINKMAQALKCLCSYIDVCNAECGMEKSDEEVLTFEPSFTNKEAAFAKAKEWLERDAIYQATVIKINREHHELRPKKQASR